MLPRYEDTKVGKQKSVYHKASTGAGQMRTRGTLSDVSEYEPNRNWASPKFLT